MSNEKQNGWGSQLAVAAVFAALGLGLLCWFVTYAEPEERKHRIPFQAEYSEEALTTALSADRFDAQVKAINAAGSAPGERSTGRYSGSPGFYRTEKLILDAFREAGLDITTQEFQVTVPVTAFCEILDESGKPLDGVELYPFQPSGLETTVLPPGGLHGNLVTTESADMNTLSGHAPSNTIVLTYLDSAADWRSLAGIGVQAVIVREDDLAKRLRASPDLAGAWNYLTSPTELGYPRFFARGPIEKWDGKPITLRCKVTWQTRKVRNVFGVLRGEKPGREAVVLNAFYDSNSLIPELAPGAEQSFSLAALIEYAHALSSYRGKLQRDVIFVATAGHAQAMAGACRLLESIETFSRQQPDYKPLDDLRGEQERLRGWVRRALGVVAELDRAAALPAEQRATAFTRERWMKEDAAFRTWFEMNLAVITGEIDLEKQELSRQAKMAYQRAGSPAFREGFDVTKADDAARKDPANMHPLLNAYLQARTVANKSANLMTLPLWKSMENANFIAWGCLERTRARLHELDAYHEQQIKEYDDRIAIRRLFEPYENTLMVNLALYSGGEKKKDSLALVAGIQKVGSIVEPQSTELAASLGEKVRRVGGKPAWKLYSWGASDSAGVSGQPGPSVPGIVLESQPWHLCGRLAFTVLNYEFYPPKACTPEDTLDGLSFDVLHEHVPTVGRALLAVGYGRVPFKSIKPPRDSVASVRGTLYTSAGSASLVPTHPMTIRSCAHVLGDSGRPLPSAAQGVDPYPVQVVNPYGEYERKILAGVPGTLSVTAARFDEEGRIVYFKDAGAVGIISISSFRNTGVPAVEVMAGGAQPPKPMNVPLFRCCPVTLYDRGNPRTLKTFQGVEFMDRVGMAPPARSFQAGEVKFLEPDLWFYVAFKDGSAANKEISDYRAFMLNVDPKAPITPDENELAGRSYLAADTPNVTVPHIDAAASMLRTGEKRLELQKRYGMADEQMLTFHERAKDWLTDARSYLADKEPAKAVVAAGSSLAYAINNHPVIRDRIWQAVVGILWYLGLLVPFVFFVEKLIFGFADIRRQLLANGIIFVLVFALLRFFHPAFQMVRSSLVILLGFIIFLLTVLVTLMISAKFKQNIKDLRSKEGRVEGADINRAGVVGTAFMLGMNNMRKRKVRTALTCVTLILITFVMICFTSVSTDLKNIEYSTGRSEWNGIMLRSPNYTGLADTEVASIRRIYGTRFPITTWQWMIPSLNIWNQAGLANPEILVDREFSAGDIKNSRRAKLSGCVAMEWNEPMFTGIDRYLVTTNDWFPRPPQTRAERLEAAAAGYKQKNYVILPDSAAAELGLTAEEVNTRHPTVTIRDTEYEVLGIIDSVKLSRALGLDGRSILPYDINSVQSMGRKDKTLVVPEDIGRLSAQQVMIVNTMVPARGEGVITVACSILFPKQPYRITASAPELPAADYREQRRTVLEYLERIGEPAFYAVDGVSYYGSRQRKKDFSGMLDLLVPILIAALTVFNTMRGSVYERKDEIYVYNAVGVAPNHVFFIFMAEACVYAVVGALMGYLLSQGTGRLLTTLGMTGGLNMDYSSIETIYASLAIMVATLLSTILPARDAARMASPADTTHWTIPEAQGDIMVFNLPFTFTSHDRIAVVSYFHRWLDSNGAGSSGPFYCSAPVCSVRHESLGEKGMEEVPVLTTTIWLKPYDLGVSQQVEIALPTDPETGEYIARITITRLSGHVTTWQRTVKPFLGTLRKQFLNWRVTTTADRTEMFAEAKRMLQAVPGVAKGKES